MASYKSIVTDAGAQKLAEILAAGGQLVLTRAACGSGTPTTDPARRSELVQPLEVHAAISDRAVEPGPPSVLRVQLQVDNAGLKETVPIRELGLYCPVDDGRESLFCYAWLDGPDSDNLLAPPASAEMADTVHVHDMGLVLTNQQSAAVSVTMAHGAAITEARLTAYAAPRDHIHQATQITETTQETVEAAQRRQDYEITALQEQLDTGFVGTTLTHTFSPDELSQYRGFDGTGLPVGVYDRQTARLYA